MFLDSKLADAVQGFVENMGTSEGTVLRTCVRIGLMTYPQLVFEMIDQEQAAATRNRIDELPIEDEPGPPMAQLHPTE